MPVNFKFKESVDDNRRREIIDGLDRAGYAARSLFPGQNRPRLAAIFTVKADDPDAVAAALGGHRDAIEYIEASPDRRLK